MEDKLVSELREQANGDRLLAEAAADEIERLNAILAELDEKHERDADEIERLRDELAKLRIYNTVIFGTSHPEIYKTEDEK